MDAKAAVPVLISSSGSPPTGDSTDHQIIRPTPRRATKLMSSSSASSSSLEAIEKILEARKLCDSGNELTKLSRKASSTSSSSNAFTPIGSLSKRSLGRSEDLGRKSGEESTCKRSEVKLIPERDVNSVQAADASAEQASLVTNVLVDGTSTAAVAKDADDSGYQILTSKDEEAERDHLVGSRKKDHPALKQGRSSLVKYKAQGRNKPRRRAANHQNRPKYQKAHFHADSDDGGGGGGDNLSKNLENANRLHDVKNAIEQMKLRSNHDDAFSSNDDASSSSYSSVSSFDSDDNDGENNGRNAKSGGGRPSSSVWPAPISTASLPTPTSSFNQSANGNANPCGGKRSFGGHPVAADEGHNTTVTSADEFVWIDSYNRLVELQKFPWNHTDLCSVIAAAKNGREVSSAPPPPLPNFPHELQPYSSTADILPRLSYYLQRALVRTAREAQRLSKPTGKCGRQEVCSALKVVLTPPLATAAVKACLRAAAMFTVSSSDGEAAGQKQTKSSRAGLLLHVGKMHRWMCLVKVGRFVHEYAAIYLTASIESVLEELIARCLDVCGKGGDSKLTATLLEQVVATSSDFWGLFQPYSHLSSCRTGAGLAVPTSLEELASGNGPVTRAGGHASSMAGAKCVGGIGSGGRNVRQALLTTCVGSVEELEELLSSIAPLLKKVWSSVGNGSGAASGAAPGSSSSSPYRSMPQNAGVFGSRSNLSWNPEAFRTLYHFVKCSQLEYVGQEGRSPIQELIYERPYMVLPPLMEWVRVASAFAEHRWASFVDSDDVQQAARILLPGMDHPIRPLDLMPTNLGMAAAVDEIEYVNLLKREMAFHMLQTGRRDLVPHALQLLPTGDKLNACNAVGLTALQLAVIRDDSNVVKLLLDAGADADGKSNCSSENKHWTPLTYAALGGQHKIAKLLLERGNVNVEGGAVNKEIVEQTETPLMLAAASGSLRMVELLLSYGANPFFSTKEGGGILGFNASAGCTSAASVAAAHGHKRSMNVLISYALANPNNARSGSSSSSSFAGATPFSSDRVMSLAEILAEGATDEPKEKSSQSRVFSVGGGDGAAKKLGSKSNVRKLQEAMYHACEATNLEITLDLRNHLEVPWTLHTWTQTLATANDNNLVAIIQEILQDFSTQWAEEQKAQFVDATLPLLFSIFRGSKTEGTVLLLADIFTACFGRKEIDRIELPKSPSLRAGGEEQPRIDPKFVNNPELSDVQFRVEGRTFYAHKLVLVTASSRFASMLASRFCEGTPPVLQINDIRYDIFHLVMVYLYNGGARSRQQVDAGDVLELMAAANFFQLPGLLRYCESRCSHLVDLDNIVSYYIHAKVYNATQLLAYCEGFLLQNLVPLLTYDDSVKRLLFGKKLQNHDVLQGLLLTLQHRLRTRPK